MEFQVLKIADLTVLPVETNRFTRWKCNKEVRLVKLLVSTEYVGFCQIKPKFAEWILQKWHDSIRQIDFYFLSEIVKNLKVRTRNFFKKTEKWPKITGETASFNREIC